MRTLGPTIETERLILRPPQAEDFEPMCAMMADEETARFIGGVMAPPAVWRSLCTLAGAWMSKSNTARERTKQTYGTSSIQGRRPNQEDRCAP